MMRISVLFPESWMHFVLRGEEVIVFSIFLFLAKELGLTKMRLCQKKRALYRNVFKFAVHGMKHNPRVTSAASQSQSASGITGILHHTATLMIHLIKFL
jgi:hypothetical protein